MRERQVFPEMSPPWPAFLDDDSLLDSFVVTNKGVIAARFRKGKFGKWETIDEEAADILLAADLDDDDDTDILTYKKDAGGSKFRPHWTDTFELSQEGPGNRVAAKDCAGGHDRRWNA